MSSSLADRSGVGLTLGRGEAERTGVTTGVGWVTAEAEGEV